MQQHLYNSIRSLRAFSVILTLLGTLLISSAQSMVDESALETSAAEIKLVLVRHEVRRTEIRALMARNTYPDSLAPGIIKSFAIRRHGIATERSRMNGLGAYLLI
jgi:hypothetical protein